MKVVIITASERRHTFFRKALALDDNIEVLCSYCEGTEKSLGTLIDPENEGSEIQEYHVQCRMNAEKDFFLPFISLTQDNSNPRFIPRGDINKEEHINHIIELRPELLVAYGCSMIKKPLIEYFSGRFLNVHLGLSPYYRGAGTNFWPLVNKEPEYVGATFMHIDPGTDTGEIIHQIRTEIFEGDTPHQIGNRLISEMAMIYIKIINNFHELEPMKQLPVPDNSKLYKRKDFSVESVRSLYLNFSEGMIGDYLRKIDERISKVPIIQNPMITSGGI